MLFKYYRNALIWAFLIFILCTIPSSGFPKFNLSSIIGIDKIVHAFFYFILYILLWFGLRKKNRDNNIDNLNKGWYWCALVCFVFGATIEILQGVFFSRGTDILDVYANSFGIFMAVAITFLFAKKTA